MPRPDEAAVQRLVPRPAARHQPDLPVVRRAPPHDHPVARRPPSARCAPRRYPRSASATTVSGTLISIFTGYLLVEPASGGARPSGAPLRTPGPARRVGAVVAVRHTLPSIGRPGAGRQGKRADRPRTGAPGGASGRFRPYSIARRARRPPSPGRAVFPRGPRRTPLSFVGPILVLPGRPRDSARPAARPAPASVRPGPPYLPSRYGSMQTTTSVRARSTVASRMPRWFCRIR